MIRLLLLLMLMAAFPLAASAQSPLEGKEKQILELTKNNWVHFRDFNGRQLIYFTHLEVYRCGISQVRYSLNSDRLDQVWELAQCDPKNPHALPDGYLPYLSLPLGTAQSIVVKVIFADGTESGTVLQSPK